MKIICLQESSPAGNLKRHTDRSVSSTQSAVLSLGGGGYPHSAWPDRGYPILTWPDERGEPHPDQTWGGGGGGVTPS